MVASAIEECLGSGIGNGVDGVGGSLLWVVSPAVVAFNCAAISDLNLESDLLTFIRDCFRNYANGKIVKTNQLPESTRLRDRAI
jgi:hypothetical protein